MDPSAAAAAANTVDALSRVSSFYGPGCYAAWLLTFLSCILRDTVGSATPASARPLPPPGDASTPSNQPPPDLPPPYTAHPSTQPPADLPPPYTPSPSPAQPPPQQAPPRNLLARIARLRPDADMLFLYAYPLVAAADVVRKTVALRGLPRAAQDAYLVEALHPRGGGTAEEALGRGASHFGHAEMGAALAVVLSFVNVLFVGNYLAVEMRVWRWMAVWGAVFAFWGYVALASVWLVGERYRGDRVVLQVRFYGIALGLVMFVTQGHSLMSRMWKVVRELRSGGREMGSWVVVLAAVMVFSFACVKALVYLACPIHRGEYFAFLFWPWSFVPKTPYSIAELDQAFALAMGILSVIIRALGILKARYRRDERLPVAADVKSVELDEKRPIADSKEGP